MFRKILVLVCLVCFAAPAFAEMLEFDVDVANGNSTTTVPPGRHISFSSPTAGVEVRVHSWMRNSSGAISGVLSLPRLLTTRTEPTGADSTYTIYDTSIKAWNIYNDTPVDWLCWKNSAGAEVTVKVQIIR